MQVGLDLVDEVPPDNVPVVSAPFGLALGPELVDDHLLLVSGVEVGNLARGEQVIDVDQEPFVGDLAFGEKEEVALLLDSCLEVEGLDVGLEVGHGVGGGDGNGVGDEAHDVGGQFGQTLLA